MHATAIAFRAELMRMLVDRLAYAVERAERPMLDHAIPGAEAKSVLNIHGTLVRPAVLAGGPQDRDGQKGALLFVPFNIGLLDRHVGQVCAKLDADLPSAAMLLEERSHRAAQGVGIIAVLKLLVSEGFEFLGNRRQRQFRDIVAVAQRQLVEEGFSQDMATRFAAERFELGTFAATASTAISTPRNAVEKIFLNPSILSVVAARGLNALTNVAASGALKVGSLTMMKSWLRDASESGSRSPSTSSTLKATARGVDTLSDRRSPGVVEKRIMT